MPEAQRWHSDNVVVVLWRRDGGATKMQRLCGRHSGREREKGEDRRR